MAIPREWDKMKKPPQAYHISPSLPHLGPHCCGLLRTWGMYFRVTYGIWTKKLKILSVRLLPGKIWLHSVNKWKSHMNIYIVWTKAFYGLKYLPNIATWIWSFLKPSFLLQIWQKNTWHTNPYTPEMYDTKTGHIQSRFVTFAGETAAEFGREKNPRHPRRASWSFRCKAS